MIQAMLDAELLFAKLLSPCHFDERSEEKSYSTIIKISPLTLEMTGLYILT
jgi:hypothetical protein